MYVTSFAETRITKGLYFDVEHFAASGVLSLAAPRDRHLSTDVYDADSAVLPGRVKVTRLKDGSYSFRSIGKKGNGRILYGTGKTRVAFIWAGSSWVGEVHRLFDMYQQ